MTAGQVEIIFYTDPLCCWSWAWEKERIALCAMLGSQAGWALVMGGLIPDWTHFRDETSSITRPSQMGPVWMHAGQVAQRAISDSLWQLDPPVSSWPSCIAVKCAQLQGLAFGFDMLHEFQILAMENGRNTAKKNVILEAGHMVADKNPLFSTNIFENDFLKGNGQASFQADLDATKKRGITRFPSLIIRASGKAILIPGYRDATTIFIAIRNMVPQVQDLIAVNK